MAVSTESFEAKQYILTASDRCDSCSAQAYYKIELAARGSVLELLFCKHDFDKNRIRLEQVAISITDESDRLVHDKLKD